jgi:hypothetical protein
VESPTDSPLTVHQLLISPKIGMIGQPVPALVRFSREKVEQCDGTAGGGCRFGIGGQALVWGAPRHRTLSNADV